MSPGSLLEIGSSVGLFLDEATKRGWKATGIEPSRWASAQAAAMGLTVFNGMLDEFEAESESFDVVASWDVWEHVQDPLDSLKRVHGLLKPGGLLALTTVNMGGFMARIMRGRWPWFLRMHLHYFTRKSLAEMVRRRLRRSRDVDTIENAPARLHSGAGTQHTRAARRPCPQSGGLGRLARPPCPHQPWRYPSHRSAKAQKERVKFSVFTPL